MIIPDGIRNDPRFINKLAEIHAHPDWSKLSTGFQERRAVWTGFDELNKPSMAMTRVENPDLRVFLTSELEDELHREIILAKDGRDVPNPDYINPENEYTPIEANKYKNAEYLLTVLDNPNSAGYDLLRYALGEEDTGMITQSFLERNRIDKEMLRQIIAQNEKGYLQHQKEEQEKEMKMQEEREKLAALEPNPNITSPDRLG